MRQLAALLLAFPAAAAPLRPGTPRLQLRLEGLFGQPTTRLGSRGGADLGAAWRLSDQLWVVGDAGQRAAPGGGIGSLALGVQLTLDATPISPYLELSVAGRSHPAVAMPWDQRSAELQHAETWQLAGRAAVAVGTQGWQASLDWQQRGEAAELHLAGPLGVGALVLKETPAGVEGAFRLILTPGAL